jgi:hypothetical protein
MSKKTVPQRDPFAFSLGGLKTIASFVPATVVADDLIRQSRSTRPCRKDPVCSAATHVCGVDCRQPA